MTLYVSERSASGCIAEALPGVGAEKLRIECNPLEACTSTGACYDVNFEGGEAKFATAAWTYVCWPDDKP